MSFGFFVSMSGKRQSVVNVSNPAITGRSQLQPESRSTLIRSRIVGIGQKRDDQILQLRQL